MFRRRSLLGALVVAAALIMPAGAQADTVKTIKYGPFTVPAGSEMMPSMKQVLRLGVSRPCSECFITSFTPDLVDANGNSVDMMSDGLMLHHAVFASQWRSDATCSGTWLGLAGERFFASGNERSPVTLVDGYGYRLHWYDRWNLLVDLMNMMPEDKQVYVQVTYTYRGALSGTKPVKPLWLDIDSCGDSEYSIPASTEPHENIRDWASTMQGRVVGMIGHVHHTGLYVKTTNESRSGELICQSNATDMGEPDMDGHIMEMSPCTGYLPKTISKGDVLRLHSVYLSGVPRDDVMGIMLGYVYRTS